MNGIVETKNPSSPKPNAEYSNYWRGCSKHVANLYFSERANNIFTLKV